MVYDLQKGGLIGEWNNRIITPTLTLPLKVEEVNGDPAARL
jgi:hypothetical protein